ncbi:hypothetical protein C4573_04750 [Candidatus Woesearchaeota archaeon]|nr:MAG: hypothetical protein C4573_04750 [Candidatus Woesearchaeota archaeon]
MALERDFFEFIYRRQVVWYRRFFLKEKPPWTKDDVLQKYKFCNVYRELDKGTAYIIDTLRHIRNRKKILLNVVFYRFFNKHLLYEALNIKPFSVFDTALEEALRKKMIALQKQGKTLFNDAYLIAGKQGEPKYLSVLQSVFFVGAHGDRIICELDHARIPYESLQAIKKIPLVGNFLAYEIWTDLTYFAFFKQKWTDDDFVNIGPGAVWGLEIIFQEKLSRKKQMEKIAYLHKKQKEVLPALSHQYAWAHISFKEALSNRPFLSLRNIEHALCEFRKYWNLSHGRGKKRKFYPIL